MEQHLSTIWDALWAYREDLIPEGDEDYDDQWNDITYAMAKIHEALDVTHETIDDVTVAS